MGFINQNIGGVALITFGLLVTVIGSARVAIFRIKRHQVASGMARVPAGTPAPVVEDVRARRWARFRRLITFVPAKWLVPLTVLGVLAVVAGVVAVVNGYVWAWPHGRARVNGWTIDHGPITAGVFAVPVAVGVWRSRDMVRDRWRRGPGRLALAASATGFVAAGAAILWNTGAFLSALLIIDAGMRLGYLVERLPVEPAAAVGGVPAPTARTHDSYRVGMGTTTPT